MIKDNKIYTLISLILGIGYGLSLFTIIGAIEWETVFKDLVYYMLY